MSWHSAKDSNFPFMAVDDVATTKHVVESGFFAMAGGGLVARKTGVSGIWAEAVAPTVEMWFGGGGGSWSSNGIWF